jgi:cellulose synthase/poly-beta-1,6-N-acetylglucosamine synthase-like glycosyltransferase
MQSRQDSFGSRGVAAAPLLLYGVLAGLAGLSLFTIVSAVDIGLRAFHAAAVPGWIEQCYLAAGVVVWSGVALCAIDLFVLLPGKRRDRAVAWQPPDNTGLTVVLTAYNDEASIGDAVRDFASHPAVRRVIVVDNNSSDRTAEEARKAGAEVVIETRPGYGSCVFRCLSEGAARTDTELTLLCEGDMTFRAYDVDKFLAYIPHAEIVNGTRIVEQLRERQTQLTTFMYYGNFFVGKLLEAKHIGKGTFTDVGTTYKLCRNEALRRLLPHLNPAINLEFNAHFLDVALTKGFHIVECPVTFHNRIGVSKGGNRSNWTALMVGLKMMRGLIFGWKPASGRPPRP